MEFDSDTKISVDTDELKLLIKELRQRVNETEFTLVPRTDDEFLAKFIRTKNYNLDSAFKSLAGYYANVYRNLNIIKGMRPSDYKDAFFNQTITILKDRHEGARIGICSAKHWNPKQHSLRDIQLTAVFIVEEGISEVQTQENGIIVIFDMSGLRWEHIRYLSAKELKRILITGTEGLPLKIRSVHFVNPPPLFWTIHAIGIRFVKEKIRKRVHFHYNIETLQKFVPKEILPANLGGDVPDDKADDTKLYETILQRNTPYERYWNGAKPSRRLSRKRSSAADILVAAS